MTAIYKSVMIVCSLPVRMVSWIAFLFRRLLISDLYEPATIMCEELENVGWFAINFSLKRRISECPSKDRLVGIIFMPKKMNTT